MKNALRRGFLTPRKQTLKLRESQRTPKSPFRECECHPPTLPKVGLQHVRWANNVLEICILCSNHKKQFSLDKPNGGTRFTSDIQP